MQTLRDIARSAKTRMKGNFWEVSKDHINQSEKIALDKGKNVIEAKQFAHSEIMKRVKGQEEDTFYLKVKELLDTYGEVSDAIGRLTDKHVYDALSYEERTKYNLELSAKYLQALERYRKEKQFKG